MNILERPAAPETREVIGRKQELQVTQAAIEGQQTCVLHFIGEAGIGKTRQLREVDKWHTAQEEGQPVIRRSFEWLGLIDLYHSDLHTPSMVERQIVASVDPYFETDRAGSPFKDYLDKRDRFEERRRQGMASEQERAELTQTFVDDYNRWAAGRRVVIAFDTLELIFYEQDQVSELCEGEAGSADAKGWLLYVLPRLQVTVILLASRSHAQLEAEFDACFDTARVRYQRFVLHRLNEQDTLDYLSDIINRRPEIGQALDEPGRRPADIYREVWQYTGGVPILISLVIDLAAFGNVAALRNLRGMQDPRDREKVEDLLVNELKSITPPIWDTLHCLAVARKGLTPELLHHLMGEESWDLDRCRQELDRLRGAAFIKQRKGTAALFLHDAVYEMLDRLKPSPLVAPGSLLPLIIDYYDEQIKVCEQRLGFLRGRLGEVDRLGRAGVGSDAQSAPRRKLVEELEGQEREWQRLQVEMVFYRLWRDPQEGFEYYAYLYNEALKAREFGFDARLHDEALRYANSSLYDEQAQKQLPRDRFDRHCGLRLIKFHLNRAGNEGYERAARVAQRLLRASKAPLGGRQARRDLLYQAELRLWRAEALLLLGQTREAEKLLKEALKRMGRARGYHWYRLWRRARLVGRAHNDLGYIYRQSQRYQDSVREYRKAIKQFRQADVLEELADTLNNLAFVYSIMGETRRAMGLLENARQLREQLGKKQPLAMSYNTTGLVHIAANEPEEGRKWCERARQIFSEVKDVRNLGLALIGLGQACRKIGDKGKRGQYSFEHADNAFKEAVKWLEQALEIFGGDLPQVREPYRHWEALNELGSTYTDWAYLLAWDGRREQAEEKYRLSVHYQQQAIQIAQEANLALVLLDSYDDLAYVYAEWGKLDEAQECLGRIYRAVPAEYRLVKGQGFKKLPSPIDGYWLVLGKYYLQRGIWARKRADRTKSPKDRDRFLVESARHFAHAMGYFQHFSTTQPYVDITSQTMYQHFKALGTERLEQLRGIVHQVARQHKVNLDRLLDAFDDTLGASP